MNTPAPQLMTGGVYRCGTALVNWYLLDTPSGVTVVDAGLPRYWRQLDAALASIGRSCTDIAGVVVTHGHADHVGFAAKLCARSAVPLWVPAGDEAMVTSGASQPAEGRLLDYRGHRFAYRFMAHFLGNGGLRLPRVARVRTYEGGARLDLPGAPRAVHVPGHTHGTSAIFVEDAGVLLAGDALCNLNPLTGRAGPQVLPRAFNIDTALALRSIEELAETEAEMTLFGHGEPWLGSVAEAVRRASAIGAA